MKPARLNWLSASLLFLFFSASAWASPARQIQITAAVSEEFKKNPDWKKDILERVSYTNKIFEPAFGLRFRIENFISWNPADETRGMPILVEELKQFPLKSADHLVAGFHRLSAELKSEKMEDLETVGTAQFFKGYIAIRDPHSGLSPDQNQIVFVHEIAHLFGAVHVNHASAIMHPSLSVNPQGQLDPENQQIIRYTKNVDFLRGIDSLRPETIDRLIAIYEKLIRGNPHSDFYYQLGDFYRKRGFEARAISVWEEALRYQYTNPRIHYELGIFYYQSGRYDQAVQELGSAIAHYVLDSQRKQKANVLTLLGAAYFEKGFDDRAVFTWMQGLALDPDNRDLQANLAAAYLKRGDIDRSLAELEKLHAKNPLDVAILSNLGSVYFQKKNYEKAAYYFSQALIKNQPGQGKDSSYLFKIPKWTLLLDLGAAYAALGDWPSAQRELLKAKNENPKSDDILRELGRVYLQQKQHKPAQAELEAALKIKKDHPQTYALLAQSYAESGNPAQALSFADQAIRYSDDPALKAMLRRNRGMIYARDRNYIKALEELKLAAGLNWNDPDTHYNMGVVYVNRQDFENAKRSFKVALSQRPDFQQAKDALKNLENKKV